MPISWSLGEIASAATARIGRRADISLSECSLWINQSIQDLTQDLEQFGESAVTYYSVSSGTSLLTLPPDFDHAVVFSHDTAMGSGLTLDQIDPSRADAEGYYPVGYPQGYFIWGHQIQLWPSADSSINSTGASSARSYRLRYVATPAVLMSASSVPTSVDTQNRIGILYRTEKYLHEFVGNREEAAEAELRYANWVSSARDASVRAQQSRQEAKISLVTRTAHTRGRGRYSPSDTWRRY